MHFSVDVNRPWKIEGTHSLNRGAARRPAAFLREERDRASEAGTIRGCLPRKAAEGAGGGRMDSAAARGRRKRESPEEEHLSLSFAFESEKVDGGESQEEGEGSLKVK